MRDRSAIDLIPSRVKYYLLDWKDNNIESYQKKYGDLSLRDLTMDQLKALFIFASDSDTSLITI